MVRTSGLVSVYFNIFFYKVVELVSEGSFINGAYPVYFMYIKIQNVLAFRCSIDFVVRRLELVIALDGSHRWRKTQHIENNKSLNLCG